MTDPPVSSLSERRDPSSLPTAPTILPRPSEGRFFARPIKDQLFPDIPEVRELARAGLNFCPLPDAQGIQEVVALYRDTFGSAITEAEAEAILARVMRFLWALNLPASQTNVPPATIRTDSASPSNTST